MGDRGRRSEARKCAPLWQFSPVSTARYTDNPDPRDIQRRAEQEVPIEDVFKSWTIGEDPKIHIDRLSKLVQSGITALMVHSAQADQRAVIDFYGKRVLPGL